MKKRLIILGTIFITIVITLSACGGSPSTTGLASTSQSSIRPTVKTTKWATAPAMTIDQNKTYDATFKTNYGDFVIQLLPKEAPLAVNNFVFLARQGFYEGVKFHRVIKGFMIQSGDPTGTGSGGPGYSFADEQVTRKYVKGTLAMANSGRNTNGSQFFITLADYPLAPSYTIFGLVTSGFDVVQKIGDVPCKMGMDSVPSIPTVDVHINSVTITEK